MQMSGMKICKGVAVGIALHLAPGVAAAVTHSCDTGLSCDPTRDGAAGPLSSPFPTVTQVLTGDLNDTDLDSQVQAFVQDQGFTNLDSWYRWGDFSLDADGGVNIELGEGVGADGSAHNFSTDMANIVETDGSIDGEPVSGDLTFDFTSGELPLEPADFYFITWKTASSQGGGQNSNGGSVAITYFEAGIQTDDLITFDMVEIFGSKQALSHFTLHAAERNTVTSVVPVPAGLPLLLSGLGILGWLGARRRRAAA